MVVRNMMREVMAAASGASAAPGEVDRVVFKKYGNRRLYDTRASRYVTLVEVEALVQGGTEIQVVDAKTGDDLTKEILVQIILEKESARDALPVGFLTQVVRLADSPIGSPLKDGFKRVVQDGLDAFLQGQRNLLDAQRAFATQVAQSAAQTATQALMAQAPQGLWNPFALFAPPPPPPRPGQPTNHAALQQSTTTPPPPPPAAPQQPQQQSGVQPHELASLKAELNETQQMLRSFLESEKARRSQEGEPETGRESSKPKKRPSPKKR
jgi:polyhydroxyalkanoate synthesis repressor PhaR